MSSKDLSIIIVDDLQFSRIVVKTALKKAGYNGVRMADSATEALTMIEQKHADVVLADWMMPEMDGLELTQQIRQRDEEKGTYTSIILFTAHDGVDYLVKAFDHGVDDYLCKPPNPQELAARVNAAARVSALQNDLLETSRQLETTIKNLEKMALVDELTGAGNERFLTNNLKDHLLEASTRRGGVCLAIVELRELDDIATKYGDYIADEILVSQHRRLRRAVRPTDIVARMNDDTFAIIMHHTKAKDYKASAIERILSMINNRAYKTTAGNMNMTGCIGIHYYRGDEAIISHDVMIKAAYNKLMQARDDLSLSIAY
ncbi:MAG: response regulator [Gammaproteobacteria bacterium]|nr:response regulator [Gammaproteobacteria bacterium]MBT8133890.1 response regulator [Gammaproteobacteria bacterium]NNJ51319.1 response regulator [Gammaproteobacteria bacterium]